jgi:hypothetical protein
MRRRASHVGLMTTGILVAGLVFAQIPEPSINALAQAATYARRFEQEFTVVGQEHYEQRWSGFSPDLDASSRRQRTIESETLFLWLPEETSWLTVRNAHAVDGLPVPDSETRLERLLAERFGDWVARVRRLRDEGARFNLGPIQRNFSDPTMVVQFLGASMQNRFRFERRRGDEVDGRAAWRLSFVEHVRPTVIQSGGRDVPAAGDRVNLRDTQTPIRLRAAIEVTFRREPRFGVWVPARMHETYEQRGRRMYRSQVASFEDRIECVATDTTSADLKRRVVSFRGELAHTFCDSGIR